VIFFLFFSIEISYRIYLASKYDDSNTKSEENTAQVAPSSTTGESSQNNSAPSSSSKSQSSSPSSSETSSQSSSQQDKIIDYFVDIALPTPISVERWTKNPFNVGFDPDALDLAESTCVDGFIRDFNNASNVVKLKKDRENADIKIYKITPEQMVQYGGEDAGWGVAFGYKNSNNERYKGEIFISNAVPNNESSKCYLMRHEMMHNMGFRGHSDRFSGGIMAVPSLGRNTENIMSEVDTMSIKMLYNTGLPLKSNEEQARAYLKANYPQ